MASTTRKKLSAISVGLVLLIVVLWLVQRRPHPAVAPTQPTAEIVTTPAAHNGDAPAISPSASVPATNTASAVILLPKPAAIATQPDIPQVPAATVTSNPAQAAASEPVPAAPEATAPEVAATARMYAAHASLRTPAVADPDSDQNRQILQAMITKALGPTGDQPTPTTNR